MNVTRITSNGLKSVKNAISHSSETVNRLPHAKRNLPAIPPERQNGCIKSFISKYITPTLQKVKNGSTTISAISEGCSEVGKNIKQAKKIAKEEQTSQVTATLKGLKKSGKAIKTTLGEIAGVNDVALAKKEGGTTKAILEGGKSTVRVLMSTALTAACVPLPIPGAVVGGWVAGEKLAEKLVGKPFSKQIKKLK